MLYDCADSLYLDGDSQKYSDYVNGLRCVISTETTTVTFEMQGGVPVLLGASDLHDATFDDYAHTTYLDDIETSASLTSRYKLTVYPTQAMLEQFHTKSPLAVSFGFVAVIIICTIIFIVYDYLMRRELENRQMILEMKRRFVRFVSHEIRYVYIKWCRFNERSHLPLAYVSCVSPPAVSTSLHQYQNAVECRRVSRCVAS